MFAHNTCHVMLSQKASSHHQASKIMFRHEGHLKQRDLFVGNVIIFIIAFKALPFLILLSLHCLLLLCSTTTTIFLLFPFSCFNIATHIHFLHKLVVLYYCTMFIVSFSAYSAPLCNFIFKNRSTFMRTLLIFSLNLPRQNRL